MPMSPGLLGLSLVGKWGAVTDPFYGPALSFGTPDAATNWTDNGGGSYSHAAGSTAALKIPNANLIASEDYQLNFTMSGRTAGSVDIVMSDGASATFNAMTGTVDDNSDNWFVTFTAPASASHVELRPTSDFDGTIVIESIRKIVWDYTIPTPVIQKYYSWDANTLVVHLACPTSVPTIASPTATYTGGASDGSFGFTSSAVAGNVANDYYGHSLVGGDADIYLKIRNANRIYVQNAWLEHLDFPALADAGSYTGGGFIFGGVTGDKDVSSNYDAVVDVFVCDFIADWNEQSNRGDFAWNTGDHTYAGYNRDQVNLESIHPNYQSGSRADIINCWGKNAADAMIDTKRDTWFVCGSFEGTAFRARGLHGFDPEGVQGFRGQPTAYSFGWYTDDIAAAVIDSSPYFMSAFCTWDIFGDWVGSRRVVDVDQALARTFLRTGDGYVGTPDETNFIVRRSPHTNQDDRNRIPFLKWGLQYRTSAGPGAWVDIDIAAGGVSRPGPFPVGVLGGEFDLSAVSGQAIDVRAWFGTHDAIEYSSTVSLTLGGSISAEMFTTPDFSSSTGWTVGSFSIGSGVATHTAGGGSGVLSQAKTFVAGQYYRLGVTAVVTGSLCNPQLSAGTTVAFPVINRSGTHRGYRKAVTGNTTARFNPNTNFDATLDDATLKAVSFAGNVV